MADIERDDTGNAAGLAALIARAAGQTNGKSKGLPPVERWNPPFCGDIDMEIRSDGTWFYMGTPIGRQPLVRLFSTVLHKDEDGKTYLVTPVEKLGIRIQDAPFVAVEMTVTARDGEPAITFRTNVGDVVEAGPDHPLRFVIHGENSELKPYLHVRGRLEALVSRAVMYDLVALGETIDIQGVAMFAVRSRCALFPVMPAKRAGSAFSMTEPRFSADDFRRRAVLQSGSPCEEAWREHGDFLLNPDVIPYIETLDLKDAAVLVPVIDDGEDARVIFTRRTATLRKHSGQVAFPGGSIDPDDTTPEVAALRETEEEIGLNRRFVETVGRLPYYMAMSGFRITPILAVVRPGYDLALNPAEVAAVFDVPLSFLMNPDNHGLGQATWKGAERHFYSMPYGEQHIWGITAGIVRMLYERLYA